MYSKLALFVLSAFALGVVAADEPAAAPAPPTPVINNSQCDVGTVHCCDSTQNAKSSGVQNLAKSLGIDLGGVNGLVGLTCNVLGGSSCSAQPVCCTGNSFGGLIVVGCSPINVSL
ncbi:fungal hydrophobin [Agaricus bisporus var. burnettii]|uniref:Hydrophobin n=1 Tax=Agaricus bisporus var. burnettii TaxID=192524 RepID=A0A8H7C3R0_AGABI|nr:fungal hydrophobin [Agaricus bisporus var. burnettii]